MTTPATETDSHGQVRAQVGAHLAPVTRFDAQDLQEAEPEQAFSVALTLDSHQQLHFDIETQRGPSRLPAQTDRVAGEAAMNAALRQRLLTAQAQAPQAAQAWVDADPGRYRRLMPRAAAFLRDPGRVGHEHTCTTCAGACQVTCAVCTGQGRLRCSPCSGSGRVACQRCHGSKSMSCGTCNGRGSWTEYETRQVWSSATNSYVSDTRSVFRSCLSCGSSGRTPCPHCDYAGQIGCFSCSGRGHNPCGSCGASGRIDCAACRASGLQHQWGTVRAHVAHQEALGVDSDDPALRALVQERLPLADLPGLGALLGAQHRVTEQGVGPAIHSRYRLRLDVRRAHLRAGQERFVIHGFGPQTRIVSFENIAGRLLADDLRALEQAVAAASRWRRHRGPGLLDALADFLRSELHMLLGERLDAQPDAALQAVAEQFSGMVDADYVARSTAVLREAVAKVYGSELTEPAAYLVALSGLAPLGLVAVGWPAVHPLWLLLGSVGATAGAWVLVEALTRRRIRRHFEGDYGQRLLAQLDRQGSAQRWRWGVGVAALTAATLGLVAAPSLPWVRERHEAQRSAAVVSHQLALWLQPSGGAADLRLRTYPPQAALTALAEAGDAHAQLVLAWRLLLGAGGVTKDVAQAGPWLQRAQGRLAHDPLWNAARAVQLLHEEALPDALRAAAADLDRAANAGWVEARYWHARLLLAPDSPLHDARGAQQGLVQAAQQQHAHAALLLGQELARGERLRRDPNAARRWLQQARQAGLPEAQTALDRLR